MNVIEKTAGTKVTYGVRGSKITFNDELMLNLESRERDTEMQIDICEDLYGCLVVGASENTRRYVAQIVIPARRYEERIVEEDAPAEEETAGDTEAESGGIEWRENRILEAVPFNMANCTLALWGLE